MKRKTEPRRVKALQRVVLPTMPWREPRGTRGAAVMEAVTKAGIELLSEKRSRDVTVVEIAKRADVARASLLLQFPGGISDVLSAAVNVEYVKILEVEEELWRKSPPRTPLEAVFRLMEAIHARASASGLLYANLLYESAMLDGEHREQVNGTFGLLGLTFAFRANADVSDEQGIMHVDAIALGEVLARSTWASVSGPWSTAELMKLRGSEMPSSLDISHVLAEALLPRIRALIDKGPQERGAVRKARR